MKKYLRSPVYLLQRLLQNNWIRLSNIKKDWERQGGGGGETLQSTYKGRVNILKIQIGQVHAWKERRSKTAHTENRRRQNMRITDTMTQYRQKGEIGDEKDREREREREGRIGGKDTVLYCQIHFVYWTKIL
jgi:hypothetical protein